jgi:uncharacterized protein YrrD
VVELKTQTQIGMVDDLIIHKTKLEVYGIVLKKTSFMNFGETQVISATDILEMNSQAVVVNNDDAIIPISEAVRLKEAIDQKYYGIHQRIVSKKGKNIGLVYDYLVDSTTQKITKFYCRTLLNEKIISTNSVIKIEGKKIIIKDELETKQIVDPAVETSPV